MKVGGQLCFNFSCERNGRDIVPVSVPEGPSVPIPAFLPLSCARYSHECQTRRIDRILLQFYDLPRRFHENAKIQHRYSKVDAEKEKRNKDISHGQPASELEMRKQRRLSFVPPILGSDLCQKSLFRKPIRACATFHSRIRSAPVTCRGVLMNALVLLSLYCASCLKPHVRNSPVAPA